MNNYLFGLLGFPLSHSFSKGYFTQKFIDLGLENHRYEVFSYENIEDFYQNILKKMPELRGFNVTIPHKIAIMDYLDEIDETARAVGAVNTVARENGKWIGYNTDISLVLPVENSVLRHDVLNRSAIYSSKKKENALQNPDFLSNRGGATVLLLGTGGASKAVIYVLKKQNIPYLQVSRMEDNLRNIISYEQLKTMFLADFQLIINATPLGMYPNIASKPDLDYGQLTERNFLLDLVYNPAETAFLQEGLQRGCGIQNGLPMLYAQADAAWEIWLKSYSKSG